jgi:acyl-coenzyme A thioesterase PaaI-like protein
MSETLTNVGEMLTASVPMVRTLDLSYDEITAEHAVVSFRDRPEYQNHVGGPHAGVLFTLGESASGAVVLAAFGDQLSRAVPLPVTASTEFLKIARGDVKATARLGRPAAEVLAELDAGQRPEFPVEIEVTREDGAVTTRMTVVWTLRPNS